MNKLITHCAAIIGLLLLFATNLQAASSVTFYHHDALGSIIATSNQDGFMSLNEEYQPYGEKIYGTEDFSSGNEDWYTGKNYSKELDLTYFGARWYDAKQGRFLSVDPAPVNLQNIHSFNRYHYGNNNPYKYVDPDGNAPRSVEFDSDGDGIPNVADDSGHGAAIHKIGDWGFRLVSNPDNRSGGGFAATKSGGTKTVQRWMSRAELKVTQETGLLRGGRNGTHYVTDAANSNSLRARQRLALPKTPEIKVTLDVPKGVFSKPSKVDPAFNMPGGGIERTAKGNIPVTIRQVQ